MLRLTPPNSPTALSPGTTTKLIYSFLQARCRHSPVPTSAAALVMLAGSPAIAASSFGCPEIPGQKLVYVDIFDGPPDKLADLVPVQHIDRARMRAWNIWQLKTGPEGLFVTCGYGKALAGPYSWMETVRLPASTRLCRADFPNRPRSIGPDLDGFFMFLVLRCSKNIARLGHRANDAWATVPRGLKKGSSCGTG